MKPYQAMGIVQTRRPAHKPTEPTKADAPHEVAYWVSVAVASVLTVAVACGIAGYFYGLLGPVGV